MTIDVNKEKGRRSGGLALSNYPEHVTALAGCGLQATVEGHMLLISALEQNQACSIPAYLNI